MHRLWLAVFLIMFSPAASGESRFRLASFRCDVTPALGEPLIWVAPAAKIEDALWAKGVVLDDGRQRLILCSIDWCGIGGAAYQLFLDRIAAAAGTDPGRIALQSVHQHTAPYVDSDGYRILSSFNIPTLRLSEDSLEKIAGRVARSVAEACTRFVPFDQIGTGSAPVERVASERRLHVNGKLITRFSTGGSNPELAVLPEGSIDPILKTITLARGDKPLIRLHYYATHPQTFCCDGRVSGDFVSLARETLEREEGVFQIYFTGCAGNVTVGKYNDTSVAARVALALRLEKGMKASIVSTRFSPATELQWRADELRLPLKTADEASSPTLENRLSHGGYKSADDAYRTAISLAFARRSRPLPATSLKIGPIRILNLPGEPMLDFQKFAQKELPGEFVAISGYGDMSPGYLCTDRAFEEGGYEPGASNAGPGTEAQVKKLIQRLLAP